MQITVGKKYFQSRLQCRENLLHDLSLVAPPTASPPPTNATNANASSGADSSRTSGQATLCAARVEQDQRALLMPRSIHDVDIFTAWARALEQQAMQQQDELAGQVETVAASHAHEQGEMDERGTKGKAGTKRGKY